VHARDDPAGGPSHKALRQPASVVMTRARVGQPGGRFFRKSLGCPARAVYPGVAGTSHGWVDPRYTGSFTLDRDSPRSTGNPSLAGSAK
jgi:hypothetical protein